MKLEIVLARLRPSHRLGEGGRMPGTIESLV
jgi:hypothetical protein